MKRKSHLALLYVLMFAAHGAAYAASESPYPADAEASISLPAMDTYADQQARKANGVSENWGVGRRQPPTAHDPFPFGGGYQDD